MNEHTKKASAWVYRGIWQILTRCFKVPEQAPTLPVEEGAFIRYFHPSPRYLSYLKLYFWFALLVIDLAIAVAWLFLYLAEEQAALLLAVPALLLIIIPDIVVYIAIHLRYDTMWYVMTDRSLRCRRGVWIILEHTITFENVQNVHVRRGPVQYFFGISTIVVETAGAAAGAEGEEFSVGNKAIMEGIDNPDEIRTLIMDRVRQSRSAGLGDERISPSETDGWRPEHLRVLREIRDEVGREGS